MELQDRLAAAASVKAASEKEARIAELQGKLAEAARQKAEADEKLADLESRLAEGAGRRDGLGDGLCAA